MARKWTSAPTTRSIFHRDTMRGSWARRRAWPLTSRARPRAPRSRGLRAILCAADLPDVPPLDPTAAQELFIQRVRGVQADFVPTAETRAALDAVCQRLDRLPRAIELAAKRMKKYGTVQALHHAL